MGHYGLTLGATGPIACLHAADSNSAVFHAAAQRWNLPTTALHHLARADLLVAAERAGELTPSIESQTREALLDLACGADAVLLTCSTLGPCIAAVSARTTVSTLRMALADEATRVGGSVIALCALETTVGPPQVFADAANRSGAQVEVRLVAGAWARFLAGDHAGYLSVIAAAADQAHASGASVVALAQASMAGARDLVTSARQPLDSAQPG